MKVRIAQYDCGCKSYVITYPSGRKKILWEKDYECLLHKEEEGGEEE